MAKLQKLAQCLFKELDAEKLRQYVGGYEDGTNTTGGTKTTDNTTGKTTNTTWVTTDSDDGGSCTTFTTEDD